MGNVANAFFQCPNSKYVRNACHALWKNGKKYYTFWKVWKLMEIVHTPHDDSLEIDCKRRDLGHYFPFSPPKPTTISAAVLLPSVPSVSSSQREAQRRRQTCNVLLRFRSQPSCGNSAGFRRRSPPAEWVGMARRFDFSGGFYHVFLQGFVSRLRLERSFPVDLWWILPQSLVICSMFFSEVFFEMMLESILLITGCLWIPCFWIHNQIVSIIVWGRDPS